MDFMVCLRISHILYTIICYSRNIEVLPGFSIKAAGVLQKAGPAVCERVVSFGDL